MEHTFKWAIMRENFQKLSLVTELKNLADFGYLNLLLRV